LKECRVQADDANREISYRQREREISGQLSALQVEATAPELLSPPRIPFHQDLLKPSTQIIVFVAPERIPNIAVVVPEPYSVQERRAPLPDSTNVMVAWYRKKRRLHVLIEVPDAFDHFFPDLVELLELRLFPGVHEVARKDNDIPGAAAIVDLGEVVQEV